MDLQQINVTIDKDGQVRIEVSGVKGEACLDLTRDLEAALGGQVALRQMTPEGLETENPLQNPPKLENKI